MSTSPPIHRWLAGVLACLTFFSHKSTPSPACATVESVGQFALIDHVYKITSGVPLISCSATCSDDIRCYSFNFIPATETCELSSAARSAVQPSFFVRRPGSLYFDKLVTVPVSSSCASSPCLNGALCREIGREPGFECQCLSGNLGRYCQGEVHRAIDRDWAERYLITLQSRFPIFAIFRKSRKFACAKIKWPYI